MQSTKSKVGSRKVHASDVSVIVLYPALLHSRNIHEFRSWLIVLILHDASYIVAELSCCSFLKPSRILFYFIFQYIAL